MKTSADYGQRVAGALDVADGIHRAHRVKMHFPDRPSMRLGLSLAKPGENSRSVLLGAARHRHAARPPGTAAPHG